MQGSSRAAAAAGQRALDSALARPEADSARLADDLFGVCRALDSNATLRRALTDPVREATTKGALANRLLAGKVNPASLEVVTALVAGRWSAERDLADTLEDLAVQAVVAGTEGDGRVDTLEDELFRFERIVAAAPALREAVTDRRADPAQRGDLVTRLLADKVQPETLRLARQAVTAPRGRRFDRVIERYLGIVARRREQLSATVISAIALDTTQRQRLTAALGSIYGRTVHLNLVVDPRVVGGIRVQIGDEVVDGTVLRKLEGARRHFGA